MERVINPAKLQESIEIAMAVLEFQRKGGVIVECKPVKNRKQLTAGANKNHAPARIPGI